jgi:5-methyltetrahydropteroyltriglutamate--homocysteine methyltransferase
MQRSDGRILSTHAGSLPRPPDLTRMMWDLLDQKPVDEAQLQARVKQAVFDVVARQRLAGVDIVSDGEMSKVGFSNYVMQRYSGFANRAQFVATDLGDFPDIINKLFVENEGGRHLVLPNVEGPIELRDHEAVHRDIANLKAALGDRSPDSAFIAAVTPGQMLFNFPNLYYPTAEAFLEAVAKALRVEYRAIVEAGFNLQLDAPDLAMRAHCWSGSAGPIDIKNYVPMAIEAMNEATRGLPPEKVRLHLCWGNYAGPHHHDVELKEIIEPVLKTNAGFIYFEAANPRHAHEWEVWENVKVPDGKGLIPGVIDTLTNHVEHPRLVAQRLEKFAAIVGKENVVAGTDCGFGTFVGWSGCDPKVAWLKLEALAQGAQIASDRLWKRQPAQPRAREENVSTPAKGPFRADHVGSLLRPSQLQKARVQRQRKNITAERLREIEDDCIREVAQMQESVGLEGITDGELRRDYWHLDFLTRIGGVEFEEGHNPLKWHREDGVELEWVPPEVKVHARLNRSQPIQLDDFKFLKSATSRTAKVCIPSPSMMIVQGGEKVIDPKIYPDPDLFFSDLSRVYAQEIADLANAGCKYVQLDDTFLAFLCDEKIGAAFGRSGEDTKKMARLSARLINDSIRNRPADMAVCVHLCRGNYQSSWLSEGGYDPVAEILLGEIDVDGYFLEYDDARSGGFAPLRYLPKGKKKIVLGLVTSKHAQLESKDALKRRIDEAAKVVPIEQLAISPQCGFSSTADGNVISVEGQMEKLLLCVRVAQDVWGGLRN